MMDLTKLVPEDELEEEKKRYDAVQFTAEPANTGVAFNSLMDALKDLSENYSELTKDGAKDGA